MQDTAHSECANACFDTAEVHETMSRGFWVNLQAEGRE